MATFNYTKGAVDGTADFDSGETVDAADFNNNFKDVRTFLTSTGIDGGHLQSEIAGTKIEFFLESLQDATEVFHFKVPAGVTLEWKEVQLSFGSGSGTLSLNVTDDGTSIITAGALTNNSAGTVTTNAHLSTSSGANSQMKVGITETADQACNDIMVTIWAGSEVRS